MFFQIFNNYNSPKLKHSWWKKSIFYEIFVRSFYDSNGDGIGDINGIIEKLDYLVYLGINALWLSPLHPSPSYHGYDVIDYYNVKPELGTISDLKKLVKEAHKRNIKIILDLVINHTSHDHPWFLSALDQSNSKYRNWYIFKNKKPKSNLKLETWHPSPDGKSFYYGFFYYGMPDLNLTNRDVTGEIYKICTFWIKETNIDGFRIDAVKYLVEEDGNLENTTSTHIWLRKFRNRIKKIKKNIYLIGEVWDTINNFIPYSANKKELDSVFDFTTADIIPKSIHLKEGEKLSKELNTIYQKALNKKATLATFISNHDIDRIHSKLDNNMSLSRIATTIHLTLPGTPFIYYGDEIGLLGSREDVKRRSPMQWTNDKQFGFSKNLPWTPFQSKKKINVQNQMTDHNSLLFLYKNLINIRRKFFASKNIKYYYCTTNKKHIYSHQIVSKKIHILILCNLGSKEITNYSLKLKCKINKGSYKLSNLINENRYVSQLTLNKATSTFKPINNIQPYGTYVILVRKQNINK